MAGQNEIAPLTGLRGIAALWVLGYHTALVPAGYLGVDLFFVLSGFVIAYNYADAGLHADGARYRDFLWRRLARIYPAYLAALLLTLACVALVAQWGVSLRRSVAFTAEGFWASVFLVQAWTLPVPRVWNVAGWSVSAEWAAYLAFPLIAARVRRIDSPRQAVFGIAVLYALLGLALARLPFPGTAAHGLLRIAAGFTAGVLLHRAWVLRGAPRDSDSVRPAILLVVLVGGAVLLDLHVRRYSAVMYLPILSCALVYALASSPSQWLCSPLAQWLGRVSYSLYIVHWPIVQLWARAADLGPTRPPRIVLACGAIACSLLVAAMFYRGIEVPARRAMLAWSTRRTARVAA